MSIIPNIVKKVKKELKKSTPPAGYTFDGKSISQTAAAGNAAGKVLGKTFSDKVIPKANSQIVRHLENKERELDNAIKREKLTVGKVDKIKINRLQAWKNKIHSQIARYNYQTLNIIGDKNIGVATRIQNGTASDIDKVVFPYVQKNAQKRMQKYMDEANQKTQETYSWINNFYSNMGDKYISPTDLKEYNEKINDLYSYYSAMEEYINMFGGSEESLQSIRQEVDSLMQTQSMVDFVSDQMKAYGHQSSFDIAKRMQSYKNIDDYKKAIKELPIRNAFYRATDKSFEESDSKRNYEFLQQGVLGLPGIEKNLSDNDWTELGLNELTGIDTKDEYFAFAKASNLKSNSDIEKFKTTLENEAKNNAHDITYYHSLRKQIDSLDNVFATPEGIAFINDEAVKNLIKTYRPYTLNPDYAQYARPIDSENKSIMYQEIESPSLLADSPKKGGLPAGLRVGKDTEYLLNLNKSEKEMYFYLYNTRGEAVANEFIDKIMPILENRENIKEGQMLYNLGKNHPILALGLNTALSVGDAVFSPLESVYAYVSGTPVSDDGFTATSGFIKNATVQGAVSNIDSEVGKYFYKGLTDVAGLYAQYKTAQFLGAPFTAMKGAEYGRKATSIINAAIQGSQVANTTMLQYKKEGASDKTAMGMGLMNAFIEGITEKIAWNKILKTPNIILNSGSKELVASIAKKIGYDAFTEGSEEVVSSWLQSLAAFITKNNQHDELTKAFDNYTSQGMSETEAFLRAVWDTAPEYAEEFLVAGFAGGMFSSTNTMQYKKTVDTVRTRSSNFFADFGASKNAVQLYLMQQGIENPEQIAKYTNAIIDTSDGKKLDADTENEIRDNPVFQGVMYGYLDARVEELEKEKAVKEKPKITEKTPRQHLAEILSNLSNKNAEAVINDASLKAEFENTVGIKIEGTKSEQRAIVKNNASKFLESYTHKATKTTSVKTTNVAENNIGRLGNEVYSQYTNLLAQDYESSGINSDVALQRANTAFDFMYNQGKNGMNKDVAINAASEMFGAKNKATYELFYTAGAYDNANALKGKEGAKLVVNDTLKRMRKTNKAFSYGTERAINAIAGRLGFDIEFVDEIEGGANASFDTATGVFKVSAKSKNPFLTAVIHEGVHAGRSVDAKSYNKLANVVAEILGKDTNVLGKAFSNRLSLYKTEATGKDGKINTDLITEEMVAEVVSHVVSGDVEFINALASQDRGFVKRIFDAVKDFFEKVMKRYTGDAEAELSPEMKAAVDMLNKEQARVIKAFEKVLDATEIKQGKEVKAAQRGEVLKSFKEGVITREDVKIIQSIGRKSINELTEAELKILDPIAKKYFGEMGVKSPFFRRWFGDWRAEDKTPITIVQNKSDTSGKHINNDTKWEISNSSKIHNEKHDSTSSIIGREYLPYLDEIIKNSVLLNSEVSNKANNSIMYHDLYAIVDKIGHKKEGHLVKLIVEEQWNPNGDTLKRGYKIVGFKEISTDAQKVHSKELAFSLPVDTMSVSDLYQLVKTYDKDFKPVPSSVVVDNNGVPKKMYRGDAENFTVFDRKKSKYSNLYGRGFYFTESELHAKQYGNARAFYLDIKNPVSTEKTTITEEELRKFVEEVAENEDYGLENYGYGATVDSVVKSVYGKTDFLMLFDISQTAIGDMVEAVELFNKVNNTSYDGFILDTETVVFNPNQIKSVENGGTFSSWDNDIMKSKPETDTETEVSEASISIPPVLNIDAEVQAKLNELVKKYGGLEKGVNPARDVTVPAKTSDEKYVRRYVRTAIESDKISDDAAKTIAEQLANDELWATYGRVGNKKSWETAEAYFEQVGFDKMLSEWEALLESNSKIEAQDIVNAQFLTEVSSLNGNVELTVRLVSEISAELTRAGQVVQAAILLKRLGTSANVYKIERIVSEIQRDLNKKYGKKAPKLKIPDELLEKYAKRFDEETKNGDGDHTKSDMIAEKIYMEIAKQIPATLTDKLRTWRYFAMLGNPRTHIRNMVGNLVFSPAIMLKNIIATTGEAGTAKVLRLFGKEMQRTKSFKGLVVHGDTMEFARKDANLMEYALKGESRYGEKGKVYDYQKIYTSKVFAWLEKLTKANSRLLEKEDWMFLKPHYVKALTMYMTANKLNSGTVTDKQLDRARIYAIKEAQKATFRDASKLAQAINAAGKASTAFQIAADSLLPFKKTPINVLKRGIEYSPIGILTSVGKALNSVKNGTYSAAEFIDGISAGFSGSAIMGIGIWLAAEGILQGASGDDEEGVLNDLIGVQAYSLKIGDATYTIDWLSPAAMSMFVGYELYKAAEDGNMTYSDFMEALPRITEPLFEMSMLQGIASIIENASYAQSTPEKLASILLAMPTSLAGQYVPTAFGQVARTIDNTRRKTYIDKNSNVPEFLQAFVQQQMKKIPLLSKELEPSVNAKGEVMKNAEGNIFSRAIQNFISPGYYKSIKSSVVDEELARLYGVSDKASNIIPRKQKQYIQANGERIDLSAEQYTEYSQIAGQTYYEKLKEIISSDYYKGLSDDDKISLLSKARDYAEDKAKESIVDGYLMDTGLKNGFETSDGYKYMIKEAKAENFGEDDIPKDNRKQYNEDRINLINSMLDIYTPNSNNYEFSTTYMDSLYEFAKYEAMEKNSDGGFLIANDAPQWVYTMQQLQPEQRVEYLKGRGIMATEKDAKKSRLKLLVDDNISEEVKVYLIGNSTEKNYDVHLKHHNVPASVWLSVKNKYDTLKPIEKPGADITKKEQVCDYINSLKLSNEQKSALFRACGYKDYSESPKGRPLEYVDWSYVYDGTVMRGKLRERTGTVISNVKSEGFTRGGTFNNDADAGQCVWYARGRAYEIAGASVPALGNANQIYANAKDSAKLDPTVANIRQDIFVCYQVGTSATGQTAGHVIYIEGVDGNIVYYTENKSGGMPAGTLKWTTAENLLKGKSGNGATIGTDCIGFVDVTKY